jgi:polysaccharide biosynthesis protein PelA
MWRFLTFQALLTCLTTGLSWQRVSAQEPSLYISYAAQPDFQEVRKHQLCILDPEAQIDLAMVREKQQTFLAYLSLVELAPGSQPEKIALEAGVSLTGTNTVWKSRLMDVADPSWSKFMIETLAKQVLMKGYDGWFLDNADSLQLLEDSKQTAARAALVKFIQDLHQRYPEQKIILNRGFGMLSEITHCLDGVLIESLFQTWDAERKIYRATAPQDTAALLKQISLIQERGLTVYIVDYVSPTDPALAVETARRIHELKAIPFISTPELQGRVLSKPTTSLSQDAR